MSKRIRMKCRACKRIIKVKRTKQAKSKDGMLRHLTCKELGLRLMDPQ